MMEAGWLKTLGELSGSGLLVVAIWILAKFVIIPMLKSHKETNERMARALDANTDAVKESAKAVSESVEHNERIISNHLSKEAERDAAIITEMRNVAASIEAMNNRRRASDPKEG